MRNFKYSYVFNLITKSHAKENIALMKKDLIKYDPTKIHEAYDQWPQIAKIAYENQNCTQYDFKNVDKILFAGMGGSGTVGDDLGPLNSINYTKNYLKKD